MKFKLVFDHPITKKPLEQIFHSKRNALECLREWRQAKYARWLYPRIVGPLALLLALFSGGCGVEKEVSTTAAIVSLCPDNSGEYLCWNDADADGVVDEGEMYTGELDADADGIFESVCVRACR